MGPAPKPADQRRRRNPPLANTVKLPAEGRRGPAPEWPFEGAAPVMWAELWSTPQAAGWERTNTSPRVVARYALLLVAIEADLTVPLLNEARQLEDRLGLTPMSMLRLRWEVAADELGEARAVPAASRPHRLKAVDPA